MSSKIFVVTIIILISLSHIAEAALNRALKLDATQIAL